MTSKAVGKAYGTGRHDALPRLEQRARHPGEHHNLASGLDTDARRRLDIARAILVGKVSDPKIQIERIPIELICKFMDAQLDIPLDSPGVQG